MSMPVRLRSVGPALRNPRSAGSWRLGASALTVLVATLAGCSGEANSYAPPPPPPVIVAHPIERSVTSYLTYTGVVEASETVDLRARVQGFLDRVNFEPGQRVRQGDLLFVIDPREYEAEARQAEANLAEHEAASRLAEITLQRVLKSAKSEAASQHEVDEALAERDQAKARVELSRAEVVRARLDVEFTQVRSPIDGRITKNFVDVGNLVGAAGEATLLATLVKTTPCHVSVNVSESDVLKVRRELEQAGELGTNEPGQIGPGQWLPCELALMDEEEFTVPGRVDYVEPPLNPETGTLRVRTIFENEDERLLAGFFARVRFPMSTHPAMLVPEAALLSDQQGRFALVVNDTDVVEVRRVKIGVLEGQMRVVGEGLGKDDRVVVLGVLMARPGSKVTPRMQEQVASGR